jgi:hypothetical protein
MTDSSNSNDHDRSRGALTLYLRTGRRGYGEEPPAETKYNPWHDAEDGRFTQAGSGNYFGVGGGSRPNAEGRIGRPSNLPMQQSKKPLRPGARSAARAAGFMLPMPNSATILYPTTLVMH